LLEHTFIHIPGVGPKTEQKLWKRGIFTWGDFLNSEALIFSEDRDAFIRGELKRSIGHREEIIFFRDRLPSGEMWRLYDSFRSKAVFLDIETSGGYQGMDEITVIGIYDGTGVQTFVSGINLMEFENAITPFDLIITFNGGSFDLPFIRRFFPNIALPQAHIDLRFLLRKLGYRGGLKGIEKQIGMERDAEIKGMDGFDAVRLWSAYQWGDRSALNLLVKYNTADVVHLKPLVETACREMKARTFPYPDECRSISP
jgi:uncharacterized protein YprB with RNaseH-like and TPR domain